MIQLFHVRDVSTMVKHAYIAANGISNFFVKNKTCREYIGVLNNACSLTGGRRSLSVLRQRDSSHGKLFDPWVEVQ